MSVSTLRRARGARREDGLATPARAVGRAPAISARAALGALLIVLAALGTYLAAHGGRTATPPPFVVAAHDLGPGESITATDVATVHVALPSDLAAGAFGDAGAVVGRVTTGPIRAGELVQQGATVPRSQAPVAHEVALSLTLDRTVGADLAPGQHVSVVGTVDGCTSVVSPEATVRQVSRPSGSVGPATQLVRLSVPTGAEAVAVVHAARTGEVTLERGTDALSPASVCRGGSSA